MSSICNEVMSRPGRLRRPYLNILWIRIPQSHKLKCNPQSSCSWQRLHTADSRMVEPEEFLSKDYLRCKLIKSWASSDWQILVASISLVNNLLSLLDRWKNPWVSLVISECANGQIYFVRIYISFKCFVGPQHRVRRSKLNISPDRVASASCKWIKESFH